MDRAIKVECPYCGQRMNIIVASNAECCGLHVKCKGRHCGRSFEIKITQGKQNKEVK